MDPSGNNQYSPAGQVDQWAELGQGLRYNRSGRRRAGRMLLGLVAVAVVAFLLIYVLVTSGLLS